MPPKNEKGVNANDKTVVAIKLRTACQKPPPPKKRHAHQHAKLLAISFTSQTHITPWSATQLIREPI